jgi:hypothetical protein
LNKCFLTGTFPWPLKEGQKEFTSLKLFTDKEDWRGEKGGVADLLRKKKKKIKIWEKKITKIHTRHYDRVNVGL